MSGSNLTCILLQEKECNDDDDDDDGGYYNVALYKMNTWSKPCYYILLYMGMYGYFNITVIYLFFSQLTN